ncbi:MAG: hypothetical protein V3S20_05110, partial [Dehalococcoidia bacterium]
MSVLREGSATRWLLSAAVVLLVGVASLIWFAGVLSDGHKERLAFASPGGGDFALDFIAAENTTYHKSGPNEGEEISPIEGEDLGFDDRTINTDTVEQLEADDFECGDRIIFFLQVVVEDG